MLMVLAPLAYAAGITLQAPSHVAVGEQFQVRYVVNSADVSGFRMGDVPADAFEVIFGPSTSTQQFYSFNNGATSQTASTTFTYLLVAKKNGTFTIPAGQVTVNGQRIKSGTQKITVSGTASQQGGGRAMQQQQAARVAPTGTPISGNDLFVKVTANKTHVYEQEPILLTYKVYTQVELTQLEGKMPDLDGFHTQEIQLPQQKTFHTESLNGKNYRCVTWSQYVMYPQMSGKLEIPALTFKGIVMQRNVNVDPFEEFFNGGSGYEEVKKEITAQAVTIQVDPLPEKPANYSGGVGKFSITSSLDKQTVKAGNPVTLRFEVSGNGNLKLIKQPEVQLPSDFDKYDPKVTDKTELSTDGLTGSMVFEMLIVPRNKGQFTIPAADFVYFDTESKSYKTLKTQPLTLTVEEGDGSGNSTASFNDNDISDILVGEPSRETPGDTFFGSLAYFIINILSIIAFIVLYVLFRKRAIANSDTDAVRGKKANKVAVKRLKKANALMTQGKTNEFYDEVLRALWGYISDKLTMPVEQLSRDNVSQELASSGVTDSDINTFIDAIDDCEFARYAPGNPDDTMHKTYSKATDAISQIESQFDARAGK